MCQPVLRTLHVLNSLLLVTVINSILRVRDPRHSKVDDELVQVTGPSVEQVSNHRSLFALVET